MPYDHQKTRDLLKIAAAYSSHPMGEYISQLSTQLFDAEAEIKAASNGQADIRKEQQEAERRLVAESAAHRATRDRVAIEIATLTAQKGEIVATLQTIAADARGAKKLALDALEKLQASIEAPKP